MRRPKRGRPRKFQLKDVVIQTHDEKRQPGVIVDYMQDKSGHGYYRVINITRLHGGLMFGPASWRESFELEATGTKYRRGPTTYRKNRSIPERGCSCNCCVHESIPLGEMRDDGTWKWEDKE